MPKPIVEKIHAATQVAWPEVTEAMATTTRTMAELAAISDDVVPHVEEYVSKAAGGTLRRRKVCEETIWVLANLGWLRTGPEREAIQTAKAFVDALEDEDSGDDELRQLEDELVVVINGMPDYATRPKNLEV